MTSTELKAKLEEAKELYEEKINSKKTTSWEASNLHNRDNGAKETFLTNAAGVLTEYSDALTAIRSNLPASNFDNVESKLSTLISLISSANASIEETASEIDKASLNAFRAGFEEFVTLDKQYRELVTFIEERIQAVQKNEDNALRADKNRVMVKNETTGEWEQGPDYGKYKGFDASYWSKMAQKEASGANDNITKLNHLITKIYYEYIAPSQDYHEVGKA